MEPDIPLKRTAYVIVHPDDFAFSVSKKIKNTDNFKTKLSNKIISLLEWNAKIIILNLNFGYELPEFLQKFKNSVKLIPNIESESSMEQVWALQKILLLELKTVKKVIMTGGWENACFKHTLNNLLYNFDRIRKIDSITEPFECEIKYHKVKKKYWIEIDQDFIF